jgi:putative ABC transport system permease protein
MPFQTFLQDLRYAARGFARNPMFTLTAVFAAALGIGATTSVFSVVDRLLFRSLPYPHDEQLVSVGMIAPLDTNEFMLPDAYFDWRKHQEPFQSITSFTAGIADCDLTESDPARPNPIRLGCARVEANFLPTFGLSPIAGRNFAPEEDRPNTGKVALISYGLWTSRFARDPNIAGKTLRIDSQPVIIIGVLPPNFEMPTLGVADILVPQMLNEATERTGRALRAFARLKPGVTIEQSRQAMQPLFQDSLKYVPAPFRKEVTLRIRSLRDRQIQDFRAASWILFASVVSVLLIACANIANLLLARSTGRRKELAVRTALGASRSRLIRQALTETALLGLIGGAAGCLLAWALLRTFIHIAPQAIPRLDGATIDGRVLLFALAGSLISGLLFGLAPAFEQPSADLLTGSRTAGARRTILRESLVTIQIAVSLILLTSAGLLLRSLWKMQSVPLGIEAEHVLTADFALGQRYAQADRLLPFFSHLESRLQQIPGITSVAITDSLPPSGGARGRLFASIQIEGQPPFHEGTGGMVTWRYITPGYFATLGIPIHRGRAFIDTDRAPGQNAVVVSESLARKLFPNGDALGHRIHLDDWSTIVGIAADVRNNGPLQPASPEYYVVRKPVPDAVFANQNPANTWRHARVAIRTSQSPQVIADWLRRTFFALEPSLPVEIGTLEARIGHLTDRPRFNAVLLSLFAAMGLLLSAIGLYGVMSYLVGQRTQEIGVRMALGATPAGIAKLVLSRAAMWTIAGAAFGLAGSFFATRAISSMLFQVNRLDPWTFTLALPALAIIALSAAWIPSLRAARVDPMTALRTE